MRHAIYAVCLLFATTGIANAQAKPNTLTPKEIADGWILLFDGETTFGWKVEKSATGNEIKVAAGALNFGDLGAAEVLSTIAFGAFEMFFEYQCDTDGTLF